MKRNPFFDTKYLLSSRDSSETAKLLEWYLKEPVAEIFKISNSHPSTYWIEKGQERTINFFHEAAVRVPAYKDFLHKHGINHSKIETFDDFKNYVPLIDKKNYISQYSLAEMCWNGNLNNNSITSFSSGTSGASCFWPRSAFQNIEGAYLFEQFFSSVFEIDKKSTLIVICFALGNYVAGTYVLSCLELMAMKGYKIMIVSPGINQEDAFRMIEKLSPEYEQTILCGYPPLLRDMIYEGRKNRGINWESLNIRFLFSSELFSEVWRDRVMQEAGTTLQLRNSTNLYGTADATLFGLEHPVNIYIKKKTLENNKLRQLIFNSDLTPTFTHYNPMLRFFEVVDEELILSSQSGLPLIRYNLHDKGGVITQEQLLEYCRKEGVQVISDLEADGSIDTLINMPHVYIFGRTDGAVSLYGLLIYPEYVKSGLEDDRIYDVVSGKFTLSIEEDSTLSPVLTVHVELASDIKANVSLRNKIYQVIVQNLRSRSAEYNRLYEALDSKAYPHVMLYQYGEDEMFDVQIKQRWIKKD